MARLLPYIISASLYAAGQIKLAIAIVKAVGGPVSRFA